MGKGWVLGRVGSCLRRNDGEGGAGMTEEAAGMTVEGRNDGGGQE